MTQRFSSERLTRDSDQTRVLSALFWRRRQPNRREHTAAGTGPECVERARHADGSIHGRCEVRTLCCIVLLFPRTSKYALIDFARF